VAASSGEAVAAVLQENKLFQSLPCPFGVLLQRQWRDLILVLAPGDYCGFLQSFDAIGLLQSFIDDGSR
jgi:hypothetical protein